MIKRENRSRPSYLREQQRKKIKALIMHLITLVRGSLDYHESTEITMTNT